MRGQQLTICRSIVVPSDPGIGYVIRHDDNTSHTSLPIRGQAYGAPASRRHALSQAGCPRSQWRVVDRTTDGFADRPTKVRQAASTAEMADEDRRPPGRREQKPASESTGAELRSDEAHPRPVRERDEPHRDDRCQDPVGAAQLPDRLSVATKNGSMEAMDPFAWAREAVPMRVNQ